MLGIADNLEKSFFSKQKTYSHIYLGHLHEKYLTDNKLKPWKEYLVITWLFIILFYLFDDIIWLFIIYYEFTFCEVDFPLLAFQQ